VIDRAALKRLASAVRFRPFHEKAGQRQAKSVSLPGISSLLVILSASRPGPVQAERCEPKGSLDGWRDARSCLKEEMAGCWPHPSY